MIAILPGNAIAKYVLPDISIDYKTFQLTKEACIDYSENLRA